MLNKKVIICIVNWNDYRKTIECLESLKQLKYENFRILLIDNGSVDGSIEKITKQYPCLLLFSLKHNIGAAAGRNIGIDYALNSGFDYIFFLDNDAVVESSTLDELIRVAEDRPDVAAVGAKTYYFNEPKKIWNFGGRINWLKGRFFDTCQGKSDQENFSEVKEVDSFPIGFGIVRCGAIKKVGKIEENYFIYYEEADWHIRMRKLGYKLAAVAQAHIRHNFSSSLGMESPYFYYYRTRNRLLFMLKNAPKIYLVFFFLYFLYDFTYHTLLTLYLSKKPQQLRAAVIGLLDFFRGRFGKRSLSDTFINRPLYLTLPEAIARKLCKIAKDLLRNIRFLIKSILGMRLKILASLDWNLGDEIMTIPVYKAIKDKYRDSILCVKVRYPELLYHNHYIDKINESFNDYDKNFNLKGESKTENRLDYLSRKLNLKLKELSPKLYLKEEELKKNNPIFKGLEDKLKICISTGANWRSRQWGVNKFKRLAEYLIKRYGAQIIELGRNCESIGLGISLINKTLVRETAVILKQCDLFIGNDSGLIHLAIAVGTPTLALFGPLFPEHLISATITDFIALKADIECQGCWSKGIMKYPDCCPKGVPVCMDAISFDAANRAIEVLLQKKNLDSADDLVKGGVI